MFSLSRWYFVFVANYNLLNKHSLVGYFTGSHHNIFYCQTESLENKSLCVDTAQNGYVSRGGARNGNYYCFAILDLSYLSQKRKNWCVTNLARWNLNPHQHWSQTHMDNQLPIVALQELTQYMEGKGDDSVASCVWVRLFWARLSFIFSVSSYTNLTFTLKWVIMLFIAEPFTHTLV